ncbi:MAG: hypothetical protein NWE93_01690 [Candidatus Bathyarchaeota archaeon]|nr:hypothetical protein [Candidatus Bathyarchaeota archaeon]
MENAFKPFEGLIDQKDFNGFFNSFPNAEEKKHFARASFMLQRATKCKKCDSDIAIALLCSSVEAISAGKSIIFKDWLLGQSINNLANKDEREVRNEINKSYEAFLKSKEREGIAFNFWQFITSHCPTGLRKPPIIVYKGEGDPFDITIKGLYSRFRSLFLHEGVGFAGIADEKHVDEEGEEIQMIAIPLLLKMGNAYVSVELTKIKDWFYEVVVNSLLSYLKEQKK